jgi:transposase
MVLAGQASAVPQERTGIVEAIGVLRAARAAAVKARTAALNQLTDLHTTAPETRRASLRGKSLLQQAQHCARLRPDGTHLHDPVQATKAALPAVAHRIEMLTEDITETSRQLQALVAQVAPRTTALLGVATEHAGQLLTTAGGTPQRLRSEAAFAALCAACPIPASSGKNPPPPPGTPLGTGPPTAPCT